MRRTHFYMVALATTFLSSCVALSTTGPTRNSNGEHIMETPLQALRSLRGVQIDEDGILRPHKQVRAADEDREERAGGWLNKFRYQSQGAHGAENLNQVTMARKYLQENPQLFAQIRVDKNKRYETYLIWRGMEYHSDEVKRAMKDHGFTKKEYKEFVKEFKNFKPGDLSFQ
ncbi:Putative RxLR effector [Phytophthora palmivora]|uniref:RxLR effector protein n=1 Tax=Phytophthora palmivora TaxID=4796 RepID=A0A2P4YKR6_9STRA|nr:Putative RxLR effector [Phytophthora palmivora]